MPFYKINMFFTQAQQGWSDTYYAEAVDPNSCYNACLRGLQRRMGILCPPAQCIAVRLSDENIYRDSSLFRVPDAVQFIESPFPDAAWTAYLVRLESQAKFSRPLYLRGIPDAMWAYPTGTVGDNNVQAQWYSQLTGFLDELIKGSTPWRIKALSKDPAYGPFQLFGAAPLVADYTDWEVTDHVGIDIGDQVSFLNTGLKPAPGKQEVYAFPSNTLIRTRYRPYRDDYTTFNTNAKWRKNVIVYIAPDFWFQERVVHRIVGRPFGLQRGRRRA